MCEKGIAGLDVRVWSVEDLIIHYTVQCVHSVALVGNLFDISFGLFFTAEIHIDPLS